jgi:hypothetical protein
MNADITSAFYSLIVANRRPEHINLTIGILFVLKYFYSMRNRKGWLNFILRERGWLWILAVLCLPVFLAQWQRIFQNATTSNVGLGTQNTSIIGHMDEVIINGDDVTITGWAFALRDDKVDRVEILLEDHIPLANAMINQTRPDVASVLKRKDASLSGWVATFKMNTLPLGNNNISAVAYDSLKNEPVKLAGMRVIKKPNN